MSGWEQPDRPLLKWKGTVHRKMQAAPRLWNRQVPRFLPGGPRKEHSPLPPLILPQCNLHQNSLLQDCEIVSLCCFKQWHLWSFVTAANTGKCHQYDSKGLYSPYMCQAPCKHFTHIPSLHLVRQVLHGTHFSQKTLQRDVHMPSVTQLGCDRIKDTGSMLWNSSHGQAAWCISTFHGQS